MRREPRHPGWIPGDVGWSLFHARRAKAADQEFIELASMFQDF